MASARCGGTIIADVLRATSVPELTECQRCTWTTSSAISPAVQLRSARIAGPSTLELRPVDVHVLPGPSIQAFGAHDADNDVLDLGGPAEAAPEHARDFTREDFLGRTAVSFCSGYAWPEHP